jgi:hypothetical protein
MVAHVEDGTKRLRSGVEPGVQRMLSLLLAAVLLVGCAKRQASAPPPVDSGITGTVTLGPMCPVERVGSPCPDLPLEADIQVKQADAVVATVHSDADGHFTVKLPPGHYVLVGLPPTPGAPLPLAKSVDVTVRPHQFTQVTIGFDSGIR